MPGGHWQTPPRSRAGGLQTGGGGGVTHVRPRRTVPGAHTQAVAAALATKGAEQTTGLMQRRPRWIVPAGQAHPPSAFWTIGGRQTCRLTQAPLRRTSPAGQAHSPSSFSVVGGLQAVRFTHSPSDRTVPAGQPHLPSALGTSGGLQIGGGGGGEPPQTPACDIGWPFGQMHTFGTAPIVAGAGHTHWPSAGPGIIGAGQAFGFVTVTQDLSFAALESE